MPGVIESGAIRKSAWPIATAGLLLFVAIVVYQGVDTLGAAIAAVGWGLLFISLFHLVPLVLDTWAWQLLIPADRRRGFARLTFMSWIGDSVNSLLPVALLGGGLARVRVMVLFGTPMPAAAASVVVDTTATVFSLLLFSFGGIGFLMVHALPGYSPTALLIGLLLFSLAVLGFYLAQRRGMFHALARRIDLGHVMVTGLSLRAAELDDAIDVTYRRRREFVGACIVRLLGWIAGAGEVWLGLYFLQQPVTVLEALMIESLGQAIRSAAFAVPGAVGIQEGAYLFLAISIGIPAEAGVALSLIKRIREVVLGLPGLLAWQRIEARRLRQRARAIGPAAGERT